MIIKIEGLPPGQKIKHINVDVQFEDDNAVVQTSVDSQPKEDVVFDEIVKDHPPKVEDSHREQKDIPAEMMDGEF